jgi:hypothetical protein
VKLGLALAELLAGENRLAADYRAVAERRRDDHDVHHECISFAQQCEAHAEALRPHVRRYAEGAAVEAPGPAVPEPGALDLLDDLRSLFLAAEGVSILWVMAGQAAQAARDRELLDVVQSCHTETELQVKWLVARIKVAAPQALVAT